jgi:nucleotide-binding universal stress UspA family protein
VTTKEIVVGIDSSPSGQAALEWAARQARLTDSPLRAIHVLDWPIGISAAGGPIASEFVYVDNENLQSAQRNEASELFRSIDPLPDWSIQFERGQSGHVLVRESQHADLLVVGTREHVGVERILIGSTSHYCLSHASCPIVAVPPPRRHRSADPH